MSYYSENQILLVFMKIKTVQSILLTMFYKGSYKFYFRELVLQKYSTKEASPLHYKLPQLEYL